MAFPTTPASSVQYAAQDNSNNDKVDYRKMSPVVRMLDINYVHGANDVLDVAGVGEINLAILPVEGMDIKIYPHMSLYSSSAFVATANLSIGWRAYRLFDGTAVVEDADILFNDIDVGGGVIAHTLWPAVAGAIVTNAPIEIQIGGPGLDKIYRPREETMLRLFATVDTANIEVGDTIDLQIAVSYGH